jgi:hypothetical protein
MSENKISDATSKAAARITQSRTILSLLQVSTGLGGAARTGALLGRDHIDAGRRQPSLMFRP